MFKFRSRIKYNVFIISQSKGIKTIVHYIRRIVIDLLKLDTTRTYMILIYYYGTYNININSVYYAIINL